MPELLSIVLRYAKKNRALQVISFTFIERVQENGHIKYISFYFQEFILIRYAKIAQKSHELL